MNPLIKTAMCIYDQKFREKIPNRVHDLYGGLDGQGYALITGSSDGIGKGIAFELAQEGFNLALVSRSEAKLNDVKEQCLRINPQIKVETVPLDFSKAQPSDYQEIFQDDKYLGGKNITMLVNNVGLIDFQRFLELPPQQIQDLLRVNMFTQVYFTKYARLNAKKHNQKTAFVHLSSTLSEIGFCYNAIYCGTKTFNKIFANSFARNSNNFDQNRIKQIDTLIVKPGTVTTNMTQNKEDFISVTAQEVGSSIVRDLGRRQESYGGMKHTFLGNLTQYTPKFANNLINLVFGGYFVNHPYIDVKKDITK
eukprot:403351860